MREPADLTRIQAFVRALGSHAREDARVYLTGGATAMLHGWRRGRDQHRADVADLLRHGLVTGEQLAAYFDTAEPQLYRYPALDPAAFRRRLQAVLAE
jgi:hypothetical protein